MRDVCLSRAAAFIGGLLALCRTLSAQPSNPAATEATPAPVVKNLLQLCALASENPTNSYRIELEGDVWWVEPASGRLVLHVGSDANELEIDLRNPPLHAGDRIRLEGNGTITKSGAGFKLGARGPVVDNNGVHAMTEKSGSVYLAAGEHPIRLAWFNGVEKSALRVEYEGPLLPRQPIPDSVLWLSPVDAGRAGVTRTNGLHYRSFEVPGEFLPNPNGLPTLKEGVVSNFDISPAGQAEHSGLEFSGFLAVSRTGVYTFFTTSDDGSLLFVDTPSFRADVIGRSALPEPRPIVIGQILRQDEDGQWAKVEGKISLVSKRESGLQLELSASGGRLRVEVADGSSLFGQPLLNAQVRVTGFCHSALTVDGHRTPGVLLVPSGKEIELIRSPAESSIAVATNESGLPVLTAAAEVHRLKREEAQRGYPVSIRGVVTCVLAEHQAFTLEDSTRGLYVVDASESRSVRPGIGEYLEVEGTTDPSLFAPIVNAKQVRDLGVGRLPDPVQPTWDQLMNGSLDAQYVEIQGIVTAVLTNGVTLRTRGGVINTELRINGVDPAGLRDYKNALVRIRGTLFASWDYATHQVKAGEIRIYNADLTVDQAAARDLFSSPAKSPAELLQFDPQAGVFERVMVSGQIICVREPEYFLMQGDVGLRFTAKQVNGLDPGDRVDVVGFPEISGGGQPVLREAVVRKTGHAPLQEPRRLRPEELMRASNDSTRVTVEALLVGTRKTVSEHLLEMQSGVRTFVARLDAADGWPEQPIAGSRLELTGVYIAQGGDRSAGRDVASFELLLNSARDIRVLARPPWWTLDRLLVMIGVLACVLAATVLWITQLRRQVDERTAELGKQIHERQRVEHQRAMEQERARVAQDLHDDLGSGITEISMLAARARSSCAPGAKPVRYLEQMGQKARELVTALDEIVWAMNPRHDSLASLVSYFALYADRFLSLANISWKLESAGPVPEHTVDSRSRHQLFLAFKEALNNVVRHSGATEVRVGIALENGQVQLTVADNGRGLSGDARTTPSMDGMANMRERIERLGGRFEVNGASGHGTFVRFSVPSHQSL